MGHLNLLLPMGKTGRSIIIQSMKQVFLKDENEYVRKFITTNIELTYRRAIKTRHSFGIGYTKEMLSDTIVSS